MAGMPFKASADFWHIAWNSVGLSVAQGVPQDPLSSPRNQNDLPDIEFFLQKFKTMPLFS